MRRHRTLVELIAAAEDTAALSDLNDHARGAGVACQNIDALID